MSGPQRYRSAGWLLALALTAGCGASEPPAEAPRATEASLQARLDACAQGGTLELAAGTVPQGLRIDRPSAVVRGVGAGRTVLAPTDEVPCRVSRGGAVLLEDLSLVATGRAPALRVEGGAVELRRCELRGDGPVVVELRDGALIAVEGQIVSGRRAGLLLRQSAEAWLQGGTVRQSHGCGILTDGPARLLARGCRIHDCLEAAVLLAAGGRGRLERCLIHDNLNGVAAFSAEPTEIVGCTVAFNHGIGIWVRGDGARPWLRRNIVTHNRWGISADGTYDPENPRPDGRPRRQRNLLWANQTDLDRLEPADEILQDPMFVDPDRRDLRLRPGSPAADRDDPIGALGIAFGE